MANTYGKQFRVKIYGESHGEKIGVIMEGLPVGAVLDEQEIKDFLARRSAVGKAYATKRKEPDCPIWESGIRIIPQSDSAENTKLEIISSKVEASILNQDVQSKDYDGIRQIPRPGHSDFAAMKKDGVEFWAPGGGRFSGRLTAALCIAGGIAKQILRDQGITVVGEILSIGEETDKEAFESLIEKIGQRGDSLGGRIQCTIEGVAAGSCGDSGFDGMEGRIAQAVFGIPGVKAIGFGAGFQCSSMKGSEHNDPFAIGKDGNVVTTTNNHGGILGGISSGMPIYFQVAVKPTPSIGIIQDSVSMASLNPVKLKIQGRHDPCIVPRAVPCVEAAAAIALLDALLDGMHNRMDCEQAEIDSIEQQRKVIDQENEVLLGAFLRRMEAVSKIGKYKREQGLPVYDGRREADIIEKIRGNSPEIYRDYAETLFREIMYLSKKQENGVFGLLGRNLQHSFSPKLHAAIGEELGIDYPYILFEKEPEEIEEFLKNGHWDGLNVTMPYKEVVASYCDQLSVEARDSGSVNTVIRKNGLLIGYNTDDIGFRETLEKNHIPVVGKRCLVLGDGGASKTVQRVLRGLGAEEVCVVSRKGTYNYQSLSSNQNAEILVNATPVGMFPDSGRCLVYPGIFPKLKWVIDLIYNPLRTNLLCQSKKSLLEPISGLQMLVSQGVASAEIFLGKTVDEAAKDKIFHKLELEQSNIILIGMPGIGKTTVGRGLAQKLGRDFYDTDQWAEAEDGRTVPQILKEEGEEFFRQLEKRVILQLSKVTGAVISCGGGVVCREENYYHLAENGKIIFLQGDISLLPIEGRPISQAVPIEQLYNERLPLYRSWCDQEIDISGMDFPEVVDEICTILGY